MKITLHDESINIELGQKVIFYHYQINDNNELEVLTDETFVDYIDEENNIVGFKNDVRSCTLNFYRNDQFGERFFLSDTIDHRLRYLQGRVRYYESQKIVLNNKIEQIYESIDRYKKHRDEVNDNIDLATKLLNELNNKSIYYKMNPEPIKDTDITFEIVDEI